jgi:hypothetical protein
MAQLKSGELDRYSLIYLNAFSHSSDHSKAFFKTLKKGKHLSGPKNEPVQGCDLSCQLLYLVYVLRRLHI